MSDTRTVTAGTAGDAADRRRLRSAAAASSIGTLIEYYDYYLYGLGATVVFPKLFFPSDSAASGSLLSFATFAVGFVLRPIGGVVFGHIADRVGRRRALLMTVVLMGIATTAIGCIPSAASIGLAAPILLVVCRLVQGLAVGGEMGGATSLIVEHAPPARRGLYGGLLISGAGIALVVSSGFMAAVSAGPDSFFLTVGWRLPFWFSAVLLVVGVLLRRRVEESTVFERSRAAAERRARKETVPILTILKQPRNAILGILIGLAQSVSGYVVLTYGLSYVVSKGTSARVGFTGQLLVGCFEIAAAPLWGILSDRIGRRVTYLGGCAALVVLIYPILWLFDTNQPLLIWLAMVIGYTVPCVVMSALLQTLLSELFGVRDRATGVNLGYQVSNTLGGGFAPLIAVALTTAAGGSWPVGVYVIAVAVISAVATLYVRPVAVRAPT